MVRENLLYAIAFLQSKRVTVQESNSTAADKVKVAYGVDGLNNVTAVSDSEAY